MKDAFIAMAVIAGIEAFIIYFLLWVIYLRR